MAKILHIDTDLQFPNRIHKSATTNYTIISNLTSLPILGALSTDAAWSWNGYLDDVIVSIGASIIDPTGYAVGNKVFEPPIRGGFDSEFKIYPIP